MDNNRKLYNLILTVLFLIFVMGLGIVSFIRLMDHYVNDTPDMNAWVPGQESRLETDMANNFYGQFAFVNLNGFMASLADEKEINDVIKLDNGYLYEVSPYFDDDEMRLNTERIVAFSRYLEGRGIPFVYVITPNTSDKYDPQIPDGYVDHGNENFDRIAEYLQEGGVNVLDLREELHRDGIDTYDMMYRTDHHWNTRMGFYTYTKISDILEKELGCTVDPKVKDIGSYRIETYKKWHLGSRGQRTGKYFGGIDDFDLFIPRFETHVASADGEREGEYLGMLVDTEPLETKDLTFMREDVNKRSIYDRVLERSQGDYINTLSHNDKKILMLTDSFGKAVCPFMDISYQRTKWEFGPVDEGDLNDFSPDAVIMMYDLSDAFEEYMFDYSWAQ